MGQLRGVLGQQRHRQAHRPRAQHAAAAVLRVQHRLRPRLTSLQTAEERPAIEWAAYAPCRGPNALVAQGCYIP